MCSVAVPDGRPGQRPTPGGAGEAVRALYQVSSGVAFARDGEATLWRFS